MPKKSKFPRLRSHSWRTAGGEVRTAYYFDMRGTGQADIPLGTDYTAALVQWEQIRTNAPRIAGTLEEAFQRWERECLPANLTTRRCYVQSLKTLRPVFGPATWESVRVSTIAEYLKKRTAKTQANREKAVLSVIWGKAREWDMTSLPFPSYKMSLKNKEQPRQIEWEERWFAALYVHAEPFLRDAMDIISATGLRVRDVLQLRLSDVRDDKLVFVSSKTGKPGTFDLQQSAILPPLIERRKAAKVPHVFLLARGSVVVSERMLTDAWARARAKAIKDCPEVAPLLLRYVRKYAGQLAGSLQEAQQLLQHGSAATTARHYRSQEKLRPVR